MISWFFGRSPLTAALASVVTLAGCGGPSDIQGLPKSEFNRVFVAAITVGAAQHCGDQVNGPLVKSNLQKYQTNQGLDEATTARSAQLYDQTLIHYKGRIAGDPTFCSTQYNPSPAKIKQYEQGVFPDIT